AIRGDPPAVCPLWRRGTRHPAAGDRARTAGLQHLIILDTNVVAELMKPAPDAAVINWLDRQSRRDLSTTSITKAEVLYGVARLPEGRRNAALVTEAERMFRDDL